jgi:hypothetical protein
MIKRLLLSAVLLSTGFLHAADKTPRELDWLELMPKDEVTALNEAPAVDHAGMFKMEQQGSFRTIAELDGTYVKLPGYIVPVDVSDDQKMSGFFLVPYFGACIHVPPPPPNQIVYVTLAEPIDVTDIYDAFWIEGTLKIETVQKDIAASAYVLKADKVTLYEG